jgi:hypothetical protein
MSKSVVPAKMKKLTRTLRTFSMLLPFVEMLNMYVYIETKVNSSPTSLVYIFLKTLSLLLNAKLQKIIVWQK